MNEDILQEVRALQQGSEETERQLDFVQQQINELQEFKKSLEFLGHSDEREMLAQIGKGIYVKSERRDEKLFVEIGAGVIIRKTPQETVKIIDEQVKRFEEAKIQLVQQMKDYAREFVKIRNGFEGFRSDS